MFCPNCGKQLNEGETCTCRQENTFQQDPPQQDQQYQQYQQYQPQQDQPQQNQQQYQQYGQPQQNQQQYQQYGQPQQNQQYQQYGQPQQQYQQQYQGGAGIDAGPINGLAIGGFLLSLVSIFLNPFFLIPGIVGIILSALAMKQCNETGQSGRGFAIAGLVISIITTIIYGIVFIVIAAACSTGFGALGALGAMDYFW